MLSRGRTAPGSRRLRSGTCPSTPARPTYGSALPPTAARLSRTTSPGFIRRDFPLNRYLIDFGASRTRIATNGKFERTVPSVLLVSSQDGRVLAFGEEAESALERAPDNIRVCRLMEQGRVADPDLTVAFLGALVRSRGPLSIVRPDLTVTVPAQFADYEREALSNAAREARFSKVRLVEEIVAHAAGADWASDSEPAAVLVVGAAYAQAGVLKSGELVCSRSLHTRNPIDGAAGDAFTANLRRHVRETFGLHIGRDQAECVLFGSARTIRAFDVGTERAEEIPLTADVINAAMRDPVDRLSRLLSETLDEARAALGEQAMAAISRRGVLLTGGGARLPGLEEALRECTAEGFVRPENPDETAIQGLLKMEARA